MFWILKVIFSKKLRESERIKREHYQRENFALVAELKKLELLRNKLSNLKSDDLYSNLFKTIDVKSAIKNINSINFIIPYLFISAKDVEELQKFSYGVKTALRTIISDTRVVDKIDGFYKKDIDENSIFYKLQNTIVLNQDQFTMS